MLNRLVCELKDLKGCESFSLLKVTTESEDFVSWIVDVNKTDNNKGQLKVKFTFPSIFTLLFFHFF